MQINTKEDYLENGYTYLKQSISQDRFIAFENTICELINSSVSRLPPELSSEFINQKFKKTDLPHLGLIKLYELSHKHEQIVVDALTVAGASFKLFLDPNLINLVCELLDISNSDNISINELFVRVDLPSKYSGLTKLIELPVHQESSYFRKNIDYKNAAVVWIPIYDCSSINGSLIVYPKTHKLGLINHEEKYIDPINKKFFRTYIPDEIIKNYDEIQVETKRGDCLVQHFNLGHKSAYNLTESFVRYTLLVRVSDITSKTFNPISWNN